MNNHVNKVMKALQEIPENELTKTIIIPLLEDIGYKKVEFFGGVNEEGKDIICWEDSKIGGVKLVVAQVKHFKFSNKASNSNSLQTVINQLIMCFEKDILYTDQQSYCPHEAFLISSHPIDVKNLQTRFSVHPSLISRKIEIIDGVKLASLLIDNEQPIVKTILGHEIDFTPYFASSLNNKTLLKALGFYDNIALKNIYTDIDFSLGKNTTEIFFNSNFEGKKNLFNLNEDEWLELKSVLKVTEKQIGAKYINLSIREIENSHQKKVEALQLWTLELEKLKKQIYTKRKAIQNLEKKFEPHRNKRMSLMLEKNEIKEKLNDAGNKGEKWKKRINEINLIIHSIKEKERPIIDQKTMYESMKERLKSMEKKEPNLSYDFEFDGKILSSILKERREVVEGKVNLYNQSKPNCTELKGFVEECKNLIDSSTKILSNKLIRENILGTDKNIVIRKNFEKTRFKLPIDEIFNTGHNIILLGEAGAGKTTCLQMYALSKKNDKDKLIIWAPLSQVMQTWSRNNFANEKSTEETDTIKVKLFDNAIFEYLISKKISLSIHEFEQAFQSRESILLLDGLDEAIKQNSWLPKAIIKLTDKYKKTQIIVASRMSDEYVDKIPFFSVTLLPFTHKQRDEFVEKWFGKGKEDVIATIKKHFSRNKSINEVTRNPLLTTTLCVIARHGLPLPQTEIKLYNDRLKLLTGYYDNVKNIEIRISTTPQNLELLSIKLAYFLHSKNVREMFYDELEAKAIQVMQNHLSQSQAKSAFRELVDPCNILVPMTSNGKYGFGHLRYQEHLAAVEIKTNRSIDIELFLTNEWWRDTLILFAQMSESIEWLVSKVNYQIEISNVKKMIYLMIQTRPKVEQKRIKQNIAKLNKESIELFQYPDQEYDV